MIIHGRTPGSAATTAAARFATAILILMAAVATRAQGMRPYHGGQFGLEFPGDWVRVADHLVRQTPGLERSGGLAFEAALQATHSGGRLNYPFALIHTKAYAMLPSMDEMKREAARLVDAWAREAREELGSDGGPAFRDVAGDLTFNEREYSFQWDGRMTRTADGRVVRVFTKGLFGKAMLATVACHSPEDELTSCERELKQILGSLRFISRHTYRDGAAEQAGRDKMSNLGRIFTTLLAFGALMMWWKRS